MSKLSTLMCMLVLLALSVSLVIGHSNRINNENSEVYYPPGCDENSCENDGICAQVYGKIMCVCMDGFTGTRCETEIVANSDE